MNKRKNIFTFILSILIIYFSFLIFENIFAAGTCGSAHLQTYSTIPSNALLCGSQSVVNYNLQTDSGLIVWQCYDTNPSAAPYQYSSTCYAYYNPTASCTGCGSWGTCGTTSHTQSCNSCTPSGCSGGSCPSSQSCTPNCSYSCGSWGACQSNSTQTQTCAAINTPCSGSTSYTNTQGCTYTSSCTGCGSWGTCGTTSHTQSCTACTPSGCSGTCSSSRSCTPDCAYSCGSWGACQSNSTQTQTCTATNTPCNGDESYENTQSCVYRGATIVSSTVPTSMGPGEVKSVSIKVKNTGAMTWTAASNIRLGGRNSASSFSATRFTLPSTTSVATNGQYTFTFNMTAPATEGTYTVDYRMLQESVAWFGDTNSTIITVAKTNGDCGSTNNSCDAGTLEDVTDTTSDYLWKCNGLYGGTTASCSIPKAYCSSAGPDSSVIVAATHTVYAYGVVNATSVSFAVWSAANGQDDLKWYAGTQDSTDTTKWSAVIDFAANHNNEYGAYNVHVYHKDTVSNTMCDTANFTRSLPACGSANGGTFSTAPTTNLCSAGTARVLSKIEGNGADGAMNLSPTAATTYNINTTANWPGSPTTAPGVGYAVTTSVAAGATSIVSASTPTGIKTGDEILIINLQGTAADYANVGLYEFATVSSVSGTRINLSSALVNAYDGTTQKIAIQRVPNWTNLTLNSYATLTANSWSGGRYGILVFRVNGTLTNNGNITMSSRGFRAATVDGRQACGYPWPTVAGDRGESYNGYNIVAAASRCATVLGNHVALTASGGAGGGGAGSTSTGRGGGGGGGAGYGAVGTAGTASNYSEAGGPRGTTYGVSNLTKIYLGSGGGASGSTVNTKNNNGGRGGGIIMIYGDTITNNLNIYARGAGGTAGASSSADDCTGGGGGGSGGSILIRGNTVTMGNVSATAGAGGAGGTNVWGGTCGAGGAGGVGRVSVRYLTSISGSSTPAANSGSIAGSLPTTLSAIPWEWYCAGADTASTKCTATQVISGCGTVNGTNVDSLTSSSANLCVTGATVTDFVFTSATNIYTWKCGTNSCSANKKVSGVCGTAKNTCTAGTLNDIGDTTTLYQWQCIGLNEGATASCSLNKEVNGACGSANGKTYAYNVTSYGTDTQCNPGNSTNTAFPAIGTIANWSCSGLYNGASVNCSASRTTASSNKAIISFGFDDLTPIVNGTIDEVNHTVRLRVPTGTDVTNLVPTITVSAGATISPASGVAQNFTNPVEYTVTAEDGSTQKYTITVSSSINPGWTEK